MVGGDFVVVGVVEMGNVVVAVGFVVERKEAVEVVVVVDRLIVELIVNSSAVVV